MMAKSVYIHIPFCKNKCNYCSFVSFDNLNLKEQYLRALIYQIKTEYKNEKLNTLYFGGGTPSLLDIKDFRVLIDLFNFENGAEITVEANPESINLKNLKGLKKLGVNRLSIGAQTFDDKILRLIGREHNSEQIQFALNRAQIAGFDNISLDLIYGLPTQTLFGFESDLKKAVESDVQHISLYGLKIEKGCYFYKHQPNEIPDIDLQADMYLKAIQLLKNSGFKHYEISNFAKSELQMDRINLSLSGENIYPFESKHNLNYWSNNTYYGFGCSASGYINDTRYSNQANLEKYIKNPLEKISEQKLSQQEILEEAIFLGFRKIAGINVQEINKKFKIDFNKKYEKILKKYSSYFDKTKKGWSLNLEGILISNEILSEFIET